MQDKAPEIVPAVSLHNLTKSYGHGKPVLKGIDLEIWPGEFFTLLGPSGSGKTTTLRLIGGFEFPDAGEISLCGEDVSRLPPYRRDVNTMFQDYALFPHMSLRDNVAYGIKIRRVPEPKRRERATQALEMVHLEGVADRRPSQLSGGQRQRVALARALVNEPSLILLDEPLGALDLKLRREMQVELKRIQKQTGITFVYVTHDQEEALSMSDRIAVFSEGRLEQVGTPQELYEHPASTFVACFIGSSNILTEAGQDILLRPEDVRVEAQGYVPSPDEAVMPGTVTEIAYLGPVTRCRVRGASEDDSILAILPSRLARGLREGEPVAAVWFRAAAYRLPASAA
ncbi:nitrate/sulfonate/bicarbonate transporter ATP-binding protein [Acetobacter estunensis NRIC 0472]|uniref:ABC transporter ATP-binding protein n=1 Tax=Acetobacter estunensis TaxID=104097 RepID=UPI002156A7D9|nr:ABC transporter ATP-binding protein [Acetobacter estunensis]GBQ21494.1 nitrate/sulfonate/bicarbonate transporter ATP-binding protein [Acetobacter estunensis NRIC 0472]